MTSSSTPHSTSQSIETCFHLLHSQSEEEKLVALTLIPKLLDPNDHNAISLLFDNMDFVLLDRMLSTHNSGSSSFPDIAISILSAFCKVPSLLARPTLTTRVGIMAKTLCSISDLELIQSGLQYLELMSSTPEGMVELIENKVFINFLDLVTKWNRSISKSSFPSHQDQDVKLKQKEQDINYIKDKKQELSLWIVSWICRCLLLGVDFQYSGLKKRIGLDLPQIFVHWVKLLEVTESQLKFQFMQLFLSLLNKLPMKRILEKHPNEVDALKQIIQKILFSKIAKEQRNPTLLLVSGITKVLGFSWLLGLKGSHTKNNADYKFASIVLQLASIEARVLLDQLPTEPIKPEDPILSQLASSYEIVEAAIEFLVSSDEVEILSLFPAEILLQIKLGLDGLFDAIVDFLIEKQGVYLQNPSLCNIEDDLVVIASVKLLVFWIEEHNLLEDSEENNLKDTGVQIFRQKVESLSVLLEIIEKNPVLGR